jgi:hypothetical protein
VDLLFQSVAGTEAANGSFGITLEPPGRGPAAALALAAARVGDNVMYFETGQGSALSAGAHHGVDQQTLEARAYAVARRFSPLLVNSVVGFIGPEYLFDGKQIIRAGLEDHFCGKLLGLPMGVDVCYTNHAEADQDDMDTLLTLLGVAGCNYVMGVPGADDVMLGYQSTSFHDSQYLRQALGLRPAPEFEAWLEKMRIASEDGRLLRVGPAHALLARGIANPEGISTRRTGSPRGRPRAGRPVASRSPPTRPPGSRSGGPAAACGRSPSWNCGSRMPGPATPCTRRSTRPRWRRRCRAQGLATERLATAASDRADLPRAARPRPDPGRRSRRRVCGRMRGLLGPRDLAILVSDGLSARAAAGHAAVTVAGARARILAGPRLA